MTSVSLLLLVLSAFVAGSHAGGCEDDTSVRMNGKTCSVLVKEYSGYCSDAGVKKNCCKSCESAMSEGACQDNPGARFNDKTCSDTVTGNIVACYDKGVAKHCCKSCESAKKGNPSNCPYGDNGHQCATIKRKLCRGLNKIACCKRCPELLAKPAEKEACEDTKWAEVNLGGKKYRCAELLKVMGPRMCYQPLVMKVCCASCAEIKIANAPKGCEWGDQFKFEFGAVGSDKKYQCDALVDDAGLREAHCKDASIKADCCVTCNK